ncbi:ribbon-helix-helix domain-containing protein [Arthrobacter sp. NPDC056493]|uniref:ribbon-helix-helix domain-containing protein n=1 Tax=Arthrobacter sp. NPDC056493 TaxID=3345839 RepID=UPI00366C110D
MALERKSSIRKAPAADVVEVLTAPEARADRAQPNEPTHGSGERAYAPTEQLPAAGREVKRPGPGRPRGKRRMEPFSSKIEIGLRDELDAYSAETGITITQLLDEALRDRLRR